MQKKRRIIKYSKNEKPKIHFQNKLKFKYLRFRLFKNGTLIENMSDNRPKRKGEPEPTKQVSKPKTSGLNSMEMLGIGLFVFAFLLYGLSTCFSDDEAETNIATETVDSLGTNPVVNTTNTTTASTVQTPPRQIDTTSFVRKLYVAGDSVRMRKEPQIGAELLAYLRIGEELTDLGERTAMEKIKLSVDEIRTAPWIKVKTKSGKVGWAFGAYLQFYPVATETPSPTPNRPK